MVECSAGRPHSQVLISSPWESSLLVGMGGRLSSGVRRRRCIIWGIAALALGVQSASGEGIWRANAGGQSAAWSVPEKDMCSLDAPFAVGGARRDPVLLPLPMSSEGWAGRSPSLWRATLESSSLMLHPNVSFQQVGSGHVAP